MNGVMLSAAPVHLVGQEEHGEVELQVQGKGPLLKLSRFALPERVALDYMEKNGCALTVATEIL